MALLSILFGQESRAFIGEIQLDASVQEEHRSSASVTEHPVEDGTVITDHVILQPDTLTMRGIITDSPVRILDGLRGAVEGVLTQLGGAVAAEPVDGSTSRSISSYRALRSLQRSREPIKVVTGLRSYSNMIMTDLVVPRSVETGQSLQFRATFRRIEIVQTRTVPIPSSILSGSDQPLAQSEQDLGRQPAGEAAEEVQEQGQSLLSSLTEVLAEKTSGVEVQAP